MAKASIVLVHGAYHQPWHLQILANRLRDAGYTVSVPQLPCASEDPPDSGLEADVAVVKAALEHAAKTSDGIVALCHSYGGVVLSEAVAEVSEEAQSKVVRLIYLAAFVPPTPGFTVRQGGEAFPWEVSAPTVGPPNDIYRLISYSLLLIEQDKLSIVHDTINMFYHDVEPSLAAEAASKVLPHANKCFSTPTKHAGWKPFRCAFVITTEDHVAPAAMVRWMLGEMFKDTEVKARWDVHELASSHSPFLSMPEKCVEIVEKYARVV